MYAQLTNKIVHTQLTHYVSLASHMGRVSLMRDALKQLVEFIGSVQGDSLLFLPREDSRYFIVEFEGVRLMTVYEGRESELVVEAIEQLPDSAMEIIIEMLNKAIQIKTLEWHVKAIDRYVAASQNTLNSISNLSNTLNGARPAGPRV